MLRTLGRLGLAVALVLSLVTPAPAEVREVRVSRQPGLLYLPLMIIEQNRLIEKHGKEAGLGDLKTTWTTFNSGGAAVDALLANNVDFVTSGVTNLLVAWSATNGQIKGVGAAGALPMWLITKNPKIKTLKDFTTADKIALPTVRVSSQATVLSMAAEKEFGLAGISKLDAITVALGHPDAYAALLSSKSEINAHFSLPPYEQLEAKIPGVHVVLNSFDVAGGPISNGTTFSSQKFHDENPKVFKVFLQALNEAQNLIRTNKRAAAQIYLQQTHEKIPLDDLVAMLNDPKMVFTVAPQRSMMLAETMFKAGTIKKKAESWHDFYFPEVYKSGGS